MSWKFQSSNVSKVISKYILLMILICNTNSFAQIEFYGLLDVEFSAGGKNSEYGINNIAADYKDPHVAINQMNLFILSDINESFSVNARLQFDTWGTGKLNPIRLSIAEIKWEPPESSFSLSIGRFTNPFGLYPQRNLSVDNLFINTPLAYGFETNISDTHGLHPRQNSNYGSDGYSTNLTTISYSSYTTGLHFRWLIVPNLLNFDFAISNAAPASPKNFTNTKNFAFISRLAIQPTYFWQQGISVSYGSFMERDTVNVNFGDLSQYKQLLLGTDWILSYSYFELSGEFIYSKWNVPTFLLFHPGYYDKWDELNLENISYYFDLKYEPPFLTGLYLAFRFEELKYFDTEYPEDHTITHAPLWSSDVSRYTVGLGYKFTPNIQFKVAYSDQKFTNTFEDPSYNPKNDLELYTIRSMFSVLF